MTCREIIEFLLDYLEGALAADEHARFEAHLAVCGPCVRYLNSYRQTIQLARSSADVDAAEIPGELIDAILASRTRPHAS